MSNTLMFFDSSFNTFLLWSDIFVFYHAVSLYDFNFFLLCYYICSITPLTTVDELKQHDSTISISIVYHIYSTHCKCSIHYHVQTVARLPCNCVAPTQNNNLNNGATTRQKNKKTKNIVHNFVTSLPDLSSDSDTLHIVTIILKIYPPK